MNKKTTRLLVGILAISLLFSCKKDNSVISSSSLYTTSEGKLLTASDSVDGELGKANAEVIYRIKGTGHGISFKCYDQSIKSSDTSYAHIVVYFALTRQNIIAGNYIDTLCPSKASYESMNFGIQDSVFVKVVNIAGNDPIGKFSIKVIENTMPIETALSLQVDAADYTTANQSTKGTEFYEVWYKTSVTPGNTYYLKYLDNSTDSISTLPNLNCDFWDKDGITFHPGTDISSGGIVETASNNRCYVVYTIPSGQSYLYIRCFNTTSGTNRIKLVSTKP